MTTGITGMFIEKVVPHDIADWPAVKIHFPFNETSGTALTDEAGGVVYDANGAGTVSFGNPAYSVLAKGGEPLMDAVWPTFPAGKFIYQIMCFRSAAIEASAGGSNTIGYGGELDDQPQIYGAAAGGAHLHVRDNAGNMVTVAPDPSKVTTVGEDFLMVLIIRPAGQLIENRLYDSTGALVWAQTITNPVSGGIGEITPGAGGGSASLEGSSGWGQGPQYQRITYQFDAEPSDLAQALAWHARMARNGVKTPYHGWKFKT